MNQLEPTPSAAILVVPPTRVVIVVDGQLPPGHSANTAAVIAATIGARHPILLGEAFADSAGYFHPGLITIGIPILCARQADLPLIRQRGLEGGCDVVDFPEQGQQTNDYQVFKDTVYRADSESLRYLGVALIGQKKVINKIVGQLKLLK